MEIFAGFIVGFLAHMLLTYIASKQSESDDEFYEDEELPNNVKFYDVEFHSDQYFAYDGSSNFSAKEKTLDKLLDILLESGSPVALGTKDPVVAKEIKDLYSRLST